MDRQQRKEWLVNEINRLADLDIKGRLSGDEAVNFHSYASELDNILRQEKNEAKDKKQEVTRRVKKAIKSGKNLEYRVSKKLGGVVVGKSKAVKVDGKFIQIDLNRPPDVVTPLFSCECKAMKSVPKKLKNACNQSYRNCPTGLTPITVLYGKDDQDYYWVIKSPHFEELYGK